MHLHDARLRRLRVVSYGSGVRTFSVLDTLRVAIVDDHVVFAEALASLLDAQDAMTVVGTASDVDGARRLTADTMPDVVLVDLRLGDESGLSLIRAMRDSPVRPRVLVVSACDDPASAAEAIRAGANGFLPKDADGKELLVAIATVRRGETFIAPHLLTGVVEHLTQPPTELGPDATWLSGLSPREMDVLVGMTAGMSRAEIAAQLCVSRNTVRTHVQHLFAKLGVHSGVEAVARAICAGLTPERARERTLSRDWRRPESVVRTMSADVSRGAINGTAGDERHERARQPHPEVVEGTR